MPRYFKTNGERQPNLTFEKSWFIIPVVNEEDENSRETETYLLPTRVADYIELLEVKVKELTKEKL